MVSVIATNTVHDMLDEWLSLETDSPAHFHHVSCLPVRRRRTFHEDTAAQVSHLCPRHCFEDSIAPSGIALMPATCHPTWIYHWSKPGSTPRVVAVCIVWTRPVERRHGAQLRRIDGWFHGALVDRHVRRTSTRYSSRGHPVPRDNCASASLQITVSIRPRPRCAAALGLHAYRFRTTETTTLGRTAHPPRAGLLVRTQQVGAVKVFAHHGSALWCWARGWWTGQGTQTLAVRVLGMVVARLAADCTPYPRRACRTTDYMYMSAVGE